VTSGGGPVVCSFVKRRVFCFLSTAVGWRATNLVSFGRDDRRSARSSHTHAHYVAYRSVFGVGRRPHPARPCACRRGPPPCGRATSRNRRLSVCPFCFVISLEERNRTRRGEGAGKDKRYGRENRKEIRRDRMRRYGSVFRRRRRDAARDSRGTRYRQGCGENGDVSSDRPTVERC